MSAEVFLHLEDWVLKQRNGFRTFHDSNIVRFPGRDGVERNIQ